MTALQTDRPAVSVVMSFYKEPLRWILASVESILKQTFTDFEFIIICDNPDYEEAMELIRQAASGDRRIRLIVNKKNIGLTKSLNIGLSLARGPLIARMDADDIAYPVRLATQVAFMSANPEVGLCSSDVDVIDGDGIITKRRRNRRKNEGKWIYMENYISHPTVMFRTGILDLRTPLYDENYRYTQDYELWIFLLSKGVRIHSLNECLVQYRCSDSNISSVHYSMQNAYFNKLHWNLISGRLLELGIIEKKDLNDLHVMLEKTVHQFASHDRKTKEELSLILYTLYFTLATDDRKYIVRYFLDRNLLAFRVRAQLSYQMLRAKISGKSKRAYLVPNEREPE